MFCISQACIVFIVKAYVKIREGKHSMSCVFLSPVRFVDVACKVEGDVGKGRDPVRQQLCDLLLVWSQKSWDFAAYETYEGARKHLVGLPSGVFKVVVWMSQHIEKSFNQFFIL